MISLPHPHAVITALLSSTLAASPARAQWLPDVRLTSQAATSITPFNYKAVAAGGDVVHAVWYDDRDGNFEIYYKRSSDRGVTWSADTRLTISLGTSWFATVAASGADVHVIWMDNRDGNYEIYHKRSIDAGMHWSADTRLTNDAATSRFPSIAIAGTVVHVTWQDTRDGNEEIYYKRSADGGAQWDTDTRLTNNTASSIWASLAASGSIVNIAWEEYRDGNGEVYIKHSSDAGLSWSVDTRLTNDPAISFSPSVWMAGSDVHVAWYDRRDANIAEIYYKRSVDGGVNWGPDTRLTNDAGGSFHPSIAASGPHVHLVWDDDRDGNDEVYYKRSLDRGVTWSADLRLTSNIGHSAGISVAIAGSAVHVLWQDTRDGNAEIYYKRNPTANPNEADISGDGTVDIDDLLMVIGSWGPCAAPPAVCIGDINLDGDVDIDDLLGVIMNWGE